LLNALLGVVRHAEHELLVLGESPHPRVVTPIDADADAANTASNALIDVRHAPTSVSRSNRADTCAQQRSCVWMDLREARDQATRRAALDDGWRAVLERKDVLRGDRDVRIRRKARVTNRRRFAGGERCRASGERNRRGAAAVTETRAGVASTTVTFRRGRRIDGTMVVAGVLRHSVGRRVCAEASVVVHRA
jgi:hypothetical protein